MGDPLLVGLQTGDEVLFKGAHGIGENARAVQEVANDEGLVDVELKLAVHAANGGGDVVAHDLGANHGEGLTLRGVDFAGHDATAGLILGQSELAETATRTAAEVANVLGDLGERSGEGVEAAVSLDNGVVGGEGLKFIGGRLELGACHLRDLFGNGLGEALKGVDAGADGGAALCEEPQIGQGALHTLDAKVELGDVAREFLAKSQRRGILQVSSSNLDDLLGLKVVHPGLESGAEAAQGG